MKLTQAEFIRKPLVFELYSFNFENIELYKIGGNSEKIRHPIVISFGCRVW